MNELLRAIAKDAAYRQLDTALEAGDGTVAVFGLPEAHRAPVNAALSERRTVVWVVPTPTEAMRLFEQQRAYRPDTLLFCRASCRWCTCKRCRASGAHSGFPCSRASRFTATA